MRAVGMTRQQLRATIRWESVIIACRGRFSVGWALVLAMKNQGITVFSSPRSQLTLTSEFPVEGRP
jgi:hypothetical protein